MKMPDLPSALPAEFLDRLDDDFIDYYNKYMAINPPTHNVSIEDIRATPKKFASPWCKDFTYEPFVNDIQLTSLDGHEYTARVYQPDPRTSPFKDGPYPIHINFHGGGYTFGDLTGDAELCMLVRNRVGIIVMDVDYRLAPEHTFYRGHDDAWAAIQWVHQHGSEINARQDSISIGGISAGGHISAVCQQQARDAGIPLKLAVLAVPQTTCWLDMKSAADSPYASFVENEFAPSLNWARLAYFRDHTVPKSEAQRAEVASRPLFIKSPIDGDLDGVCDTLIATAGCDPLRDEGEAYGRCLVERGVRVGMRRYTGVPHPFMHMLTIRKAQLYIDDVCAELRRAHGA